MALLPRHGGTQKSSLDEGCAQRQPMRGRWISDDKNHWRGSQRDIKVHMVSGKKQRQQFLLFYFRQHFINNHKRARRISFRLFCHVVPYSWFLVRKKCFGKVCSSLFISGICANSNCQSKDWRGCVKKQNKQKINYTSQTSLDAKHSTELHESKLF